MGKDLALIDIISPGQLLACMARLSASNWSNAVDRLRARACVVAHASSSYARKLSLHRIEAYTLDCSNISCLHAVNGTPLWEQVEGDG